MSSQSLPQTPPGAAPPTRRRVIFVAGVGNALEWYDWSVYAVFAPFFAKQFFDPANPVSAMLSTLAVFAVGFLMRPLGGLFFGWFADRVGRQRGMVASMGITALGSVLIAVAPTYAATGVLASIVLVVARLLQGFGLGGEIGASHTFLAEAAPPVRRGLWSSSMYVAVTSGVLFATVLGAALGSWLSAEDMASWGWRVPFVIGAVLGIYAFYLRRRLTENAVFTAARAAADENPPGLAAGIWAHRRSVLRVVGLTVGGTVSYYTWAIAAPSYAISVKHIDPGGALWAAGIANVVLILVLPVWGAVSDRWGRKPVLLCFLIGQAVLTFPLTWLVQDSAWQLGLAMSVALVVQASALSILPAAFAEMFPTRVRASGMAVPYSIAVALTGGTAPYLQTFLAGHGLAVLFSLYCIGLLAVGVAVVVRMPETKGMELT